MTVATWVCCSMISEIQIRYGSRVCCHGRSLRPCACCQAISRAAKVRRKRLPPCETLPGLSRCFGRRILGDQVLERAPRPGGVAELDLTACNIEQGVGHFLAV